MKLLKGFLIGLVATATLSVAQPAAFADALTDDVTAARAADADRVLAYLTSPQFVPSRIEFRSISADPVSDLIQIATSRRHSLDLRIRAIESLPLYTGDERARETVDSLLANTSPNNKMFGPTLVAYAAFHGEAVTEAVAPFAEHPDPSIRLAAVVALGRFCGQLGFEMLKNLSDKEEDPFVKARIDQLVN